MRKARKVFSLALALVVVMAASFSGVFAAVTKVSAASNYLSDGWYYLKNVNSQMYLDVANDKDADFANVDQEKGLGDKSQRWYIKNLGNNVITLTNGMAAERMLDVYYGKTENGTNIDICGANGSTAQQFNLVKSSKSGVYCLTTVVSGGKQAVDVYEWSTKAGGNISTWEYNGLECQQFVIEAVSENIPAPSTANSSSNTPAVTPAPTGNTITVKNGGTSLESAIKSAKSGTTIIVDGTVKSGAIELPSGVNISGKNNATIDFSSTAGSAKRGITMNGSGSTLSNLTIKNAADNGIYITGSNNTFNYVNTCYNDDAGVQVSNGGAYNKFYNCHSHHNADAKGENADGFAVKLHSGEGNYFENCIADYNSDDGWDCYAAHGAVKFKNCQANYNGFCDGIYGDGNGFKLGGVDNKTEGKAAHLDPLNHYLEGCKAIGNYASGFDRNNQNGVVTMKNCYAESNKKYNYNWPLTGSPSALGYKVTFGKAIIQDCTSKNGKNKIDGATLKGNCVGF